MKSIIDCKYSKWKKENVTIVTDEYIKKSDSSAFGVVIERGYIFDKSSIDDIDFAWWIQNTIGGKITVKKKNNNKPSVDYDWEYNGIIKQWEKKSPTTINAISNRVKQGYKQLSEANTPGGFFMDLIESTALKIDDAVDKLLYELYSKGSLLKGKTIDVIVTHKRKIVICFRINK